MPKSSIPVCSLFYGYPVEEIMGVCAVSRATALHFKRGRRTPSPQAQRLWWLHIGGRILGPEWRRFRVYKDALVDGAGHRYSEDEIGTIPLLHMQVASLQRDLDQVRYAEEVGRQLEFFELSEAVRGLLQSGEAFLTALGKIPQRSADSKRTEDMNSRHRSRNRDDFVSCLSTRARRGT